MITPPMLEYVASDELASATLALAHASITASATGVKTTFVVIVENPDGRGVANVYVDGELKETPMEIGMVAQEVADKARRFAVGIAGKNIEPTKY